MKSFDKNYPFRLCIHITKNDGKGKALQRMAQGTIVAYPREDAGSEALEEFVGLCDGLEGVFTSYGLIALVNEPTGEVVRVRHLS